MTLNGVFRFLSSCSKLAVIKIVTNYYGFKNTHPYIYVKTFLISNLPVLVTILIISFIANVSMLHERKLQFLAGIMIF